MGWIISFVALTLVMVVLTVTGLRQPIKTTALTLPAVSIGDRVVTAFVVFTFTAAFIYGLTLLAARLLL